MALSLVTAPTTEPVTLDDVKNFVGQADINDDDALLESLIVTARQEIDGRDGWLGRALCTQTWDWKLDGFPCVSNQNPDGALFVPLPPLQSVTSITYVATDGTSTTWSSSEYQVDIASQPGRIVPAYGYTWPDTRSQLNAVTVRFVAGYGDETTVPEAIKQWLRHRTHTLYDNRNSEQASHDHLLASLRVA